MSDIPSENAFKEKPKRHTKKQPTKKDNPSSPPADFTALVDAIKTEGAAYRKEERREDRGKRFREWITISLIGLTFVAVCLQVYEMIKVFTPVQVQAVASEKAATAAKESADATRAYVNLSGQSAEQQQRQVNLIESELRPWVDVDPEIAGDLVISEGRPPAIELKGYMRNLGKTPSFQTEFFGLMLALDVTNGVYPPTEDRTDWYKVRMALLGRGNHCFPTERPTPLGPIILPNKEGVVGKWNAYMKEEAFAAAQANVEKTGVEEIYPLVVVCVRYDWPTKEKRPSYIVKVFHLIKKGCERCGFKLSDGSVPKSQLDWVPYFWGNHVLDRTE